MSPVAILVGGLATRLRPLTEKIPKSLVHICGRPFIFWQLALLRAAGISEVILCTGYLGEKIKEQVGDGSRFGLQVRYSPDGDRLLGTGGAIKNALSLLGPSFFVLYGDSYVPISFLDVEKVFHQSAKDGLMTVFKNEGRWDASNVRFVDGEIREYDKQHRVPEMRHIDYGLSVFSAKAFLDIREGQRCDLSDIMKSLLQRGELASLEVTERFYEIGSHRGIAEFETYLKSEHAPSE